MNISEKYWNGLKEAYYANGAQEKWEEFENTVCGISDENKKELIKAYPEIPNSLLQLLEYVDGTYHRKYGDKKVRFYFLGSDVDDGEYPYYLYSAEQIIEQKDEIYNEYFGDLFYCYNEEDGADLGLFVDDRIKSDGTPVKWLCFSDCMNNGGTSSLFIDFSPSEKGVKGQIVRFLHDPDELRVIANSFDEYLKNIIDNKFAFINEDMID